jgi:hypothetical protein
MMLRDTFEKCFAQIVGATLAVAFKDIIKKQGFKILNPCNVFLSMSDIF